MRQPSKVIGKDSQQDSARSLCESLPAERQHCYRKLLVGRLHKLATTRPLTERAFGGPFLGMVETVLNSVAHDLRHQGVNSQGGRDKELNSGVFFGRLRSERRDILIPVSARQ